ncbi:hypothetical protein [Alicyclobacillus fodiniaquatilis]|uniref:DUF1173 family protein n=1 Tax=Alicyclobacillus fodiniaquatilis TaxID=1661150 RepID=A0ABW4JI96_9BACL
METMVIAIYKSKAPVQIGYSILYKDGWDQQVFKQLCEPERPKLYCTCSPLGRVPMHVKRRPKGIGRYFIAIDPNAAIQHSLNCPLYHLKEDSDLPRLPPYYETGVDRETKNGNEFIHVNIRVFASQTNTNETDIKSNAPSINQLRQIESSEFRFGRTKLEVAFGGLFREWYILGLGFAQRTMSPKPSREQLLRGMWKVLINKQITVEDGPFDKIAIVPFSKVKWRLEGQPRVIVGYVISPPVEFDNSTVKVRVRGIDTEIDVLVRNRHLPNYRLDGRLCALRVVCQNQEYWSINHVQGLLIYPDGAVWLDSSYEWQAYEFLLKQRGLAIVKPLMPSPEWYDFKPDFVLTNTKPQTVIEVWGMPDVFLHYHEQKKRKKKVYQYAQSLGKLQLIEWNVQDPMGFEIFSKQIKDMKKS